MVVTYLVIGSVGLLIALVSLAFGDLFDLAFDVLPEGALSTTTIAATLAGFGFVGAAADALWGALPTWAIILIAGAGAVVGWVFAWLMVHVTRRQEQPDGATRLDQIVGRTATVVEAPREAGMAGTVVLSFLGSDKRMHFRSAETIAEGDQVTVTAVVSTNQVKVSRLTD